MVSAAHGDGVAVVVLEGWLPSWWRGWGPVFAKRSAGCTWCAVERDVGEENRREFGDFVIGVWKFGCR